MRVAIPAGKEGDDEHLLADDGHLVFFPVEPRDLPLHRAFKEGEAGFVAAESFRMDPPRLSSLPRRDASLLLSILCARMCFSDQANGPGSGCAADAVGSRTKNPVARAALGLAMSSELNAVEAMALVLSRLEDAPLQKSSDALKQAVLASRKRHQGHVASGSFAEQVVSMAARAGLLFSGLYALASVFVAEHEEAWGWLCPIFDWVSKCDHRRRDLGVLLYTQYVSASVEKRRVKAIVAQEAADARACVEAVFSACGDRVGDAAEKAIKEEELVMLEQLTIRKEAAAVAAAASATTPLSPEEKMIDWGALDI